MKNAGGALFRHDRRSVTSSVLTWTACWNVARLGELRGGFVQSRFCLKTRKRICADIQVIPISGHFFFFACYLRQLQPESNFAGQRLKTAQKISVLLLASLTCNCSPCPLIDRLTQSCCLGCALPKSPLRTGTLKWARGTFSSHVL